MGVPRGHLHQFPKSVLSPGGIICQLIFVSSKLQCVVLHRVLLQLPLSQNAQNFATKENLAVIRVSLWTTSALSRHVEQPVGHRRSVLNSAPRDKLVEMHVFRQVIPVINCLKMDLRAIMMITLPSLINDKATI